MPPTMLYRDANWPQFGPVLPEAVAGDVRIDGSTPPRSMLPACSWFSSAWVVVKATSLKKATCAFCGPEYFGFGTKVALPRLSNCVKRHGPSTPLCHSFPVKVLVFAPSAFR